MRTKPVARLLACLVLVATPVVPSQAQRRTPTVGVLNYAAAHDVRVVQSPRCAIWDMSRDEISRLSNDTQMACSTGSRGWPPNWPRPRSI